MEDKKFGIVGKYDIINTVSRKRLQTTGCDKRSLKCKSNGRCRWIQAIEKIFWIDPDFQNKFMSSQKNAGRKYIKWKKPLGYRWCQHDYKIIAFLFRSHFVITFCIFVVLDFERSKKCMFYIKVCFFRFVINAHDFG